MGLCRFICLIFYILHFFVKRFNYKTISRLCFVRSIFYSSGEYQTVIEGYDSPPSDDGEKNTGVPLFGEMYSNNSDYHQVFVNQNIVHTGGENEPLSEDERYQLVGWTYIFLCSGVII
jgi:hypothetical protein